MSQRFLKMTADPFWPPRGNLVLSLHCAFLAGNTCFVNAAVQCLRYTPGLPLMLIPDLLDPQPLDSAPSLQPAPSAGVIQAADAS